MIDSSSVQSFLKSCFPIVLKLIEIETSPDKDTAAGTRRRQEILADIHIELKKQAHSDDPAIQEIALESIADMMLSAIPDMNQDDLLSFYESFIALAKVAGDRYVAKLIQKEKAELN